MKFVNLLLLVCLLNTSLEAREKYYEEPQGNAAIITMEADRASTLKSLPLKLNVLIWNIYKGANKSIKKDYAEISQNKHLVLLQETQLNSKVKATFKGHPRLNYKMATSFKMFGKANGVSTGSLVKSTEVSYVRSQRELGFTTPKIALLTHYPLQNGEELLVINIHAINFVNLSPFQNQIDDLLTRAQNHFGPVIFAGDFNTWSDGKFQYLTMIMESFGFDMAHFSNDTRVRAPVISRWDSFDNPLDHVFVREAKIQEANVWTQFKGSDHNPITVKIEIKE